MATTMVPTKLYAKGATTGTRSLNLLSLHTRERKQGNFWVAGDYQLDVLSGFNQVLRDHRQNITAPMDKRLFDLLFQLQTTIDNTSEVHIISGYRSPKTNAMLASKSSKVAKKSYHMRGMAMDIAIPDVKLSVLREAAISLNLGGVGYYPRSGFIHVDTGHVRNW
jgi:uncharacterized protein YcbK (DUF882 family)